MSLEGTKRKLAAILSADVQEYSRLMSQDEMRTIHTLTTYKAAMSDLIEEYRGHVVDSPGDNLLAEFASVIDAVNCAVEIQRDLAQRNAELPDDRRMEFRIGVNQGDIVHEEGRIYGDGVNVAARLEGLAEGGGICISGKVYDEVRGKLELEYEDRGEQSVKNIPQPVRVYRVLSVPGAAACRVVRAKEARGKKWKKTAMVLVATLVVVAGAFAIWKLNFASKLPPVEPASVERMAFPLPEKPSIAVLAFDNLSSDPEQGYFADGITEDIITTLSHIHNLFVIARNSTFVYKGKPVKVQQVAEELGVRYVLEGSVQKAGDRVRISAQLNDALTGHHLWAQRYDRDVHDLFALQDEITHEIVIAMAVELTQGEQARIWLKHTDNVEAWGYVGQGMEHFHRFTQADNALARQLFEKAVDADPEYALAYSILAWTHWMDAMHGWSESRAQSVDHAANLAHQALSLDDALPDVYALLGAIHLINREYDEAIALGRQAVALNPNHSNNMALLAMTLGNAEQPHAAIRTFRQAMRLSPYYPDWYLESLGFAYLEAGEPEQGLATLGTFLERQPNTIHAAHAHLGRAVAYHVLGRATEGRAEVARALEVDPGISVTSFAKLSLRKDKAAVEKNAATLRRLGLPQ